MSSNEILLYPVKYKSEYRSIDPCPADKTNRSRLIHSGLLGSNFKKFLKRTAHTSAIPMGIPGCPEFAFCTASIDKKRIAFARSECVTFFIKTLQTLVVEINNTLLYK